MLISVNEETLKYWNERVQKLAFQGVFIQLLVEENEKITWKSIINILFQIGSFVAFLA